MKKNVKRIMFGISILSIALTISCNVFKTGSALKANENSLAIVDIEEMMQTEEFKESLNKSLEEKFGANYQEIIEKNSQSVEKAKTIDGMFMKTRSDETIYPDYYGGMYIDDNEDLVVQIVRDKIPEKNSTEYEAYLKMLNNSKAEYVKYSYNELKNVLDSINDYAESNLEVLSYFESAYVDLDLNRVVVSLKNNDFVERKAFINLTNNTDFLSFIESSDTEPTATFSPGSAVKSCTMGFRAIYNGQPGIVTAGHCVMDKNAKGEYEYIAGIGPVTERIISGSVDVAFIESAEDLSLTNTLKYSIYPTTSLSTSFVSSFVVKGQIIGKVGMKSGAKTGKITQTSMTLTNSSYGVLTDMVEADAYNDNGDSGGPIFTINKTAGDILGIVHGRPTNGNTTRYTKLDNIRKKMNISRY